ncbi:unnamed protein product [Paramecium sonneborni]|uniref:Uncharacterized protein n=1 Tax=Paramecium sonneborni TaxID=65129 RepID=A0A8S1K4J3_9CILI|nr:unnamed protein product [Paramecium sonneborni]
MNWSCPYPNHRQFYAPIIITINLMYLSGTISTTYTSELQNGILYFGCIIGSKLYKYFKSLSNRLNFYITDLIVLIVSLIEIYRNIFFQVKYQEISLLLIFVIGIAAGINFLQIIFYLKLTNTEYDLNFFSLFIPLQFAIGNMLKTLQAQIRIFHYDSYKGSQNIEYIVVGGFTILRIILITIIPIQAFSQNIKQMEQAQQNSCVNSQELNNEQTQQEKESNKYIIAFLRNFKYLIIIMVFQTSSIPFQYHFSQIPIIIFHMILFSRISRSKTIIFGQICVCFGFSINIDAFSIIGYYFGLGTLFYNILCKIWIEDLIVIAEINWIIRMSTMCFIAVMQKLSQNLFLIDSQVENNVFFILNFITLIFLFLVLFQKEGQNKVIPEIQMNLKQEEEEIVLQQ